MRRGVLIVYRGGEREGRKSYDTYRRKGTDKPSHREVVVALMCDMYPPPSVDKIIFEYA